MKTKRSIMNIFFNIVGQFVSLGLGILIPRLFLVSFGSEINGAVTSIGQIFTCIGLLEAGIGGVTTQALYKTVANDDKEGSNRILSAAAKYYKKMGFYYIGAVAIMSVLYPTFVKSAVPRITLFLIILFTGMGGAINFFLQYKYTVILNAEGRNYVLTNINMLVNVLTSVAKVVLLMQGFNIIAVQFSQFLITLLRIFILNIYVKKEYKWIDFEAEPDYAALSQRNAQLIHQVSYMIFSNTDVLLLTFCVQDLKMVSVYAIYNMLLGVLEGVISSVNNGLTFAFGQIYTEDKKKYRKYFDCYEVAYMAGVFSIFLVTLYYILPFIKLYTSGITDVGYVDFKLALLFVVLKLFVAMRSQCYNAIIISGNFKKTQNSAIIEALINLTASVILVNVIGIYGVLLGTIVALLYRNTYCIVFANKNILNRSPFVTFRRWILNMIIFGGAILQFDKVVMPMDTYLEMAVGSIGMLIGAALIVYTLNYLFERKVFVETIDIIKNMVLVLKQRDKR